MDRAGERILFGCGTPRTLRAHWALQELGLDYDCEPFRPRTDDVPSPRMVAVAPRGKVPVLLEGDFALRESAAIVTYLYSTHGADDVAPGRMTPRARALYDQWSHFVLSEIDGASLLILRRHNHLAHLYGEAAAAVRTATAYFHDQIRSVAEALSDGRPWLLGDRFTGIDIITVSTFGMADPHGIVLDPVLADYRARAEARPAFVRATTANSHAHWRPTPES
jgi:glutathione S-transferase